MNDKKRIFGSTYLIGPFFTGPYSAVLENSAIIRAGKNLGRKKFGPVKKGPVKIWAGKILV